MSYYQQEAEALTEAGKRLQAWAQINGVQIAPLDCDRAAATVLNRVEKAMNESERKVVNALSSALESTFGLWIRVGEDEWNNTAKELLARMGVTVVTLAMEPGMEVAVLASPDDKERMWLAKFAETAGLM
jgi:hypothetical protein